MSETKVFKAYKAGIPIDIKARNIQGKWTLVMGKSHGFDFVRYDYRLSESQTQDQSDKGGMR